MNDLERLGKKICQAQDAIVSDELPFEEAKQEFIAAISNAKGRSRFNAFWKPAPLMGVIALVSTWMFLFLFSHRPLDDTKQLAGKWIESPVDKSLQVQVSPSGVMLLGPNTRSRIVKTDDNRKLVVLEQGQARFDITYQKSTRWFVNAGPYQVKVTGTVFDVNWQPEASKLNVSVNQGQVVVVGPLVPDGQLVGAKQTFSAYISQKRVEIKSTEPTGKAPPSQESKIPSETAQEYQPAQVSPKTKPQDSVVKKSVDPKGKTFEQYDYDRHELWVTAAKKGNYKNAFNGAMNMGIRAVLKHSNPKELLLLADAARLSGHHKEAQKIYLKLKNKFPNNQYAVAATLNLGRMAFDQQKNYANARRWLKQYLAKQPQHVLKREALGRLLEAELKLAKTTEAKQTAGEYIRLFSNGPHADLAKRTLKNDGNP